MALSLKTVFLVLILVLSVSASGIVFAQSDHVNRNKTVLDVSYVIQHLDSLYGKKITVNGTYDYRYPFPFAMSCGWASIPNLPKSINHNSDYLASPWGNNYLFHKTAPYYGAVLELRSANATSPYIPLPVTLHYYEPATLTGKLVKQYVKDDCGTSAPTYFQSGYLLVDPPKTGKINLETKPVTK